MYIPRGKYVTVTQYMRKLGGVSRSTVLKAIKENRIKGAIQLDKNLYIIPEDAVLFSKTLKNGKYVGVTQFIRGNIAYQEEAAGWEMKQAQLRKMRAGDLCDKDPVREDADYDYNQRDVFT